MAYNFLQKQECFFMEKLLKPKDLQEILGCSMTKVYTIIRENDFPKIKIGRQYYMSESEITRWIDKYTMKEYHLTKKQQIVPYNFNT